MPPPSRLGEKLQALLNPQGDLDVALAKLRALNIDVLSLSAFEKELVKDAVSHL